MMNVSLKTDWPHLAVIAILLFVAAFSWQGAPDRIPVHWSVAGEVDRYGGKFEGLFAIPLLAAGIWVLMILIPRIDPGRANYASFQRAYATLRLAIIVFLAFLYGVIQLWIHGRKVDLGTVMPLGMGGLFIVLGNLMGKLRPNWFVGIRTPWTLSSALSWDRTHRVGGWVFILSGLLSMTAAFLPPAWAFTSVIGILGAATLGLVIYSYVVWRDDPERIPPTGTTPAEPDGP